VIGTRELLDSLAGTVVGDHFSASIDPPHGDRQQPLEQFDRR
jgi:hypothetical protein